MIKFCLFFNQTDFRLRVFSAVLYPYENIHPIKTPAPKAVEFQSKKKIVKDKIASKKMMTVKFVKKGLDQNLAWQIISIHFMKKRNFLSHIELKLHLHHFRYFSGSTNHVSFILFTFFLKRVSFSVVFQIQWLERISLFWKSRVHFTTQWSTQRKVQFMGFQRVSKDVLLLVNVVD